MMRNVEFNCFQFHNFSTKAKGASRRPLASRICPDFKCRLRIICSQLVTIMIQCSEYSNYISGSVLFAGDMNALFIRAT